MPGRQDARTAGRQDGRSPGRQDANTARPGRTGRPPERTRVHKMTEMSEFRRPAPSMLDHVGVGGMLDNDIPGLDESRLRGAGTRDAGPARACAVESSGLDELRLRETTRDAGPIVPCAVVTSGLDESDTSDRRAATATCNGRVIIRPEEPGRDNGLDEAVTAELVGQPAIDLCAQIGDDIPI